MAALYTNQINFLGSQILHDTKVRWLGTYAQNQIPSNKNEKWPFALVVNADVTAGTGEHWLAFYAFRNSFKIEMFDSFGLPPNIYSFDPSLIHFSSRSIQSFGSKVCKHYALLFIYFKSRNYSLNNTINNLDKNFTDASAARKIYDLSCSKLSHVHCTCQCCKNKSTRQFFELYYYGEFS